MDINVSGCKSGSWIYVFRDGVERQEFFGILFFNFRLPNGMECKDSSLLRCYAMSSV